jgi:FkbM family methyltransferase
MKPSSFIVRMKPLLKNDLAYHVLVTRSIDYLSTQYTLKTTRLQLNEIRRRLGTGLYTYDLGEGLRMEFDLSQNLDAFMCDYLLRFGRYERGVEAVLSRLITKGTTFVDVGANVGYFTVLFSRSARMVYAFEPVPAIFERLSRNLSLNGCENVRALQLAVSKEKGTVKMYESKISNGHDSTVRRFEHDRSMPVDATSLDEAIDPSAGDIVMKVDVEGSETDVLMGGLGLIRSGRVSAIVVEWSRRIYPSVANLRERFALYSAIGSVEVIDDRLGAYRVTERLQVPDFCNLLIRVRK